MAQELDTQTTTDEQRAHKRSKKVFRNKSLIQRKHAMQALGSELVSLRGIFPEAFTTSMLVPSCLRGTCR